MPVKFYPWLKSSAVAVFLLMFANFADAQMTCNWQIYAPYSNPLPGVNSPCLSNSITIAIQKVWTTGGILNINNGSAPAATTGCPLNGYSYYNTAAVNRVKQNAGATFTLNMVFANPGLNLWRAAIYIDWNHDGNFDPVKDIVPLTSSQNLISNANYSNWNASLTVPTWAQNGPTRMRIRVASSATGGPIGIAGACDTIPTGESEDYDVEVVNPCLEPAVISVSNITCNSAKIDWSTRGNATFYDVWVDTTLAPWSKVGAPDCAPTWCSTPPCYCKFWHKFSATQTTTQLPGPVNAHLQSNRKYYVCIRSICDTFQKPLFWTWDTSANWAIDSFSTLACCDVPNVTVTQSTSTTVTFSWNPVFTAHGYEYAIATTHATPPPSGTVINGTSVTVPGLTSSKTYYFYLRALCTPTPTSDWGETPCATTNTLAVTNVQTGVLRVLAYPNPVKNVLTIETEGVMHPGATVTVTNITGRIVESIKMNDKLLNVNTAAWPSGFYTIKYSDEVTNKVIKITKE